MLMEILWGRRTQMDILGGINKKKEVYIMGANEIQEMIDSTEYWDVEILDLDIKYFGDEISMIIYNDDETSWKLTFLSCYKLQYETDSTWRNIPYVKDMRRPQMGYYGQDISVSQSEENSSYIDIKMDLSIMKMEFTFKEVILEKVCNNDLLFFWNAE